MTQVFVSYARPDEATARRVAKALEAAGYDVWWDSQLPAHRAYSEVIERNLNEAKAAVVLWSQAAAQSQWVRAEADLARSEGKLVQAHLDGTMPPLPPSSAFSVPASTTHSDRTRTTRGSTPRSLPFTGSRCARPLRLPWHDACFRG